ncbi:MAG: TRAP transporter substrate-binding protein [Bacteroidaceae bacterium]|nr:TRAP transporter substrate-binding protein [Bacteroidaceae bacterium]
MKKKLVSFVLAAAMVMSMTACGLQSAPAADTAAPAADTTATADAPAAEVAPAADAITLVYAEVNPEDTIVGQLAADFKSKVEELSGGQIIIDVQYSGVLGAEQDVLDTMMGGGNTIQMARISAFALTSYGGQKSMLLSLPYTFVDRNHFWNFAESDLAKEFLEESSATSGVTGLFYGEEGFRHFFTTKEIKGMSDLSGMKLRVSNDPVMNGLVNSLGANPTVVSFSELYSALQSGVVDGAEQPIANYKSNAFPEVANNLILDGHTLGAVEIIITNDAWAGLTPEQQGWITEAGKYAQAQNKANSESKENEVLEQLKADGCNVVDVADKSEWQNAVKDVVTENTKGYEDLYQKLLDLQ